MIAGHIVEMFGFTALNIIVGLISLAYAPILYFLKDMHSYKVRAGHELYIKNECVRDIINLPLPELRSRRGHGRRRRSQDWGPASKAVPDGRVAGNQGGKESPAATLIGEGMVITKHETNHT